ncbi:MAG: TlpA disulfide reductase family protein [Myxococcota bacterium]
MRNVVCGLVLFGAGCQEEVPGVAEPAPVVQPAPPPPVAAKRAAPAEVSAVGQPVADLEVSDWLTTETTADAGETTLVVFWEKWCPHCRREVPRLQEVHEKYGPEGLNLVALTRLTRNVPRADAAEFLETSGVTYPAAVGGTGLANRLGIRGIPAAVAIQDGTVVWQGHPARITDALLDEWTHRD